MPRAAKFGEEQILAAAAKLVAASGPAAATMTAIRGLLGAPSGSIYHRFRTRDELLGRLWLSKARSLQNRWLEALALTDPIEVGLQAALSMPRSVREDLDGAKVMLLYRREDFLSDAWPPEVKAEAGRLGKQVHDGIAEMTRRLFDRDTVGARRATAFATLDIPFSAVRRYVVEGKAPPTQVDAMIEGAYRGVIERERQAGE